LREHPEACRPMFPRPHDYAHQSWTSVAPVSKNGPSSVPPLPPRRGGAFTFGEAALHILWRRSSSAFSPLGRGKAGKFRDDRAGYTDNLRKSIEHFLPAFACIPRCVQLAAAGPEVDAHRI